MSNLATAPKPKRVVLNIPGHGALSAAAEVYRDGEEVVVVGRVDASKKVRVGGTVEMQIPMMVFRFKTVEAYEYCRDRAAERDMLKYTRLVGIYGEDDDARQAPELPESLRQKIDESVSESRRQIAQIPEGDTRGSLLLLPGERAA